MQQTARPQIAFRIITDDDTAFLQGLYNSTRAWEFAHTTWTPGDRAHFLEGQFMAQSRHYSLTYPRAVHRIIQLDQRDIGRLIVDRQDDCLRLIDLTLAPEQRGRGIGTDILRSLINEAHGGKVPLRLHVEKTSPAIRLYLRHGFRATNDQGHHFAMEWHPAMMAQAT